MNNNDDDMNAKEIVVTEATKGIDNTPTPGIGLLDRHSQPFLFLTN